MTDVKRFASVCSAKEQNASYDSSRSATCGMVRGSIKFMMPDSDRFNISALSNTVLRQGHTLLFCISICTISIRRIGVRDNLDFNAEDEGYHECEVNVKVSCSFPQNIYNFARTPFPDKSPSPLPRTWCISEHRVRNTAG